MSNAVRFWWKTFHQALGSGKSHAAYAHLKNYALRSERDDFTQPLHTLISLADSQD